MSTIEDTQPITCRELVELVTDYLEGQLRPGERERIERHLADCDGCTAYIEQMRFTLRALGSIPEETIPEHAREALLVAFRDVRRGESR
jgi:anti-sigma factor RsiW